ncbi:hypothetical protein PIROE2DRAFT_1942 [Piromyces sp. E2]|nr:hypothetical protein PIROE2DRAFT_1942 [Piromyces sp. E2]|eukprot:OUM70000.1 hypothetical protein PIROE2DRAFT_1942 [Piromyces sp. E2]
MNNNSNTESSNSEIRLDKSYPEPNNTGNGKTKQNTSVNKENTSTSVKNVPTVKSNTPKSDNSTNTIENSTTPNSNNSTNTLPINNNMNNNSTINTTNSTLPELFSFEQVKQKYKNFKGKCTIEGDTDNANKEKCPDDLQCVGYDYCELLFKCNENDLTRCANNYKSEKYFSTCNTNADCLSNSCVNNVCTGRLLVAAVGSGKARYGLELGEKCTANTDCFQRNCKGGICVIYDSGESVKFVYGGVCIAITLIIIYSTFFMVFRGKPNGQAR